ncbi:hypothetical protein SRABI27_02570 [Pedobacter sp. Bi27]|uniref:hypothetical protein n=1 Tax=Pedobacter sp. Bi27 TaxID=2822351 RepID=UPI001DBB0B7A|nr:hypothetical protein [Pedobacter sp. Bi27]CAH0234797.1 hypothetical protein SRABI27_02570 [Pedobacter sp. Bi27]
MKFTLIIYLLLLVSSNAYTQSVTLKGRVVDAKNNIKLSGATVKVGNEYTRTDHDGYFEMTAPLKTLTALGINFSHVGYFNIRLIYQSNHFYEVKLTESSIELQEVIIAAGDDIIKKAIKRIVYNYPNKPIIIKGILRTQSWRNQSEYFKSDALIKAYVPAYDSKEKTTVAVVQNRMDTLYDKTLKYLKHTSNYNVVDFQDIAHNNYILHKIAKKKKFDYLLAGKEIYDNHKVFVINITTRDTSKQYDKIQATLYIDTATYAFVAANTYTYNLIRAGFLPLKMLNYRVAYEKIGEKWYLKETHTFASSELKKESPRTTVDFIRTEIDSIDVDKISYKDIVQHRDDVLLINKPRNNEEWENNSHLFQKAEKEGRMERLSSESLDTIKSNNGIANSDNQKIKRQFGRRVFDYFNKDNVRTTLGLTKFPVLMNDQFYRVSESINYGFGLGINYRLYKNLFLGFQVNTNLRNDKHINLSTYDLNISHDFILNKNSRNLTFTPYAGFEQIVVRYNEVKVRNNTFNYGLRVAYELTHKKAIFLSSGFNSGLNSTILNTLSITPSHYAIGLGVIFKK